jgi:hypothetical protein
VVVITVLVIDFISAKNGINMMTAATKQVSNTQAILSSICNLIVIPLHVIVLII